MRYQNELEVNSRRAGRGVLVGRVVRQPGGPHPVEYGQGPALTLWPLLRVPRISAGPQSGMAWKIARSSPAEEGRTRAWCGTTERASMLRFRGKVIISVGTLKSQMPWHHEMCPWESRSGGPESGGLHQSAPAERMRAFQSDGSRTGNGVSEQPRMWVTEVPDPPGDEGRVWKRSWVLKHLGYQA